MQTQIGHIQFNIDGTNIAFYRELLAFLGWQTIYDGPTENRFSLDNVNNVI